MQTWQDSLYHLGRNIFDSSSEVNRLESNFTFVKTLVSALKETNSFFFEFDRLNMISTVKSPDNNFRIFSWNVPLHDGSYLYYGALQFKSGTLKLIPLLDKTFEIAHVNEDILDNSQWFGAQYYHIIQLHDQQYILLGWKGESATESKKVIEVMNVSRNGEITFGSRIFTDNKDISRKIFTYHKSASFLLQYNPEKKRIEFDNLIFIPDEFGPKKLVPDMTHNGYEIKKNKLILVENIEVLNSDQDINSIVTPKSQRSGLKL